MTNRERKWIYVRVSACGGGPAVSPERQPVYRPHQEVLVQFPQDSKNVLDYSNEWIGVASLPLPLRFKSISVQQMHINNKFREQDK